MASNGQESFNIIEAHNTKIRDRNKNGQSKSSGCVMIFMIGLVLLLVIAILGILIALLVMRQTKVTKVSERNAAVDETDEWINRRCFTKKCSKRWDPLPVIMISMDGFWANYMDRGLTPTLQRIADCGVHAPFMYSCYPTKTFPNHYSMVTGLYPESHGIVGNNIWDATIEPPKDRYFQLGKPSSYNPKWWKGEPMWNTVQKNGYKSASYYWPGSEIAINGMLPNYLIKYNKSIPFSTRINQIVKWVMLPEPERPSFINLYLNQPDANGHKFGPFSEQVNDALMLVDGAVNHLMTELYRNDLLSCVNLLIVADHGMQQLIEDSSIIVHDYVNTDGMRVFSSAAGRILIANSTLTTQEVVDSMRCKNGPFRVYPRKDLPVRLHYSGNERIGDIIVDGDPGYYVYGYPTVETEQGAHGYDYKETSMHALFMALGPGLKQGLTVEPFENIELYNLIADLLNLDKRAPTNGTVGSLRKLLRQKLPQPPLPQTKQLDKCFSSDVEWSACRGCPTMQSTKVDLCDAAQYLSFTPLNFDTNDLCYLDFCLARIAYRKPIMSPIVVETLLSNEMTLNESLMTESPCTLSTDSLASCSMVYSRQSRLSFDKIGYYPLISFSKKASDSLNILYQKVPMYDGLVKGMWRQLQQLTETYVQVYGNVLIMTGPIFDYNRDGLVDTEEMIRLNTQAGLPAIPTHIFQILIRCDGQWTRDGFSCQDPKQARVLSFVLPNKPSDINCMSHKDYLFMNTARVRDIEQLTGTQFLTDPRKWSAEQAVRLRIHINDKLW